MANIKISGLPSATFTLITDQLEINQGGVSKSVTGAKLAALSLLTPNATKASPNVIVAISGITPSGAYREFQFVKGDVGGIVVSANPQIAPGTLVGQELLLQGCDNTDTITLNDGTGLNLNGICLLKSNSRLALVWDGTIWGEVTRNDL